MIDYIPWLYNLIQSFKKTLNSKQRTNLNLKAKDKETQKTKTQKDQNLVLSKE